MEIFEKNKQHQDIKLYLQFKTYLFAIQNIFKVVYLLTFFSPTTLFLLPVQQCANQELCKLDDDVTWRTRAAFSGSQ